MKLDKITKYIKGYVQIQIEGYYIERFLNLCRNRNIFLQDIVYLDSITLKVNININDIKEIKQLVKKTKNRMRIKNKYGLPFVLHKYRKRKMVIIPIIILAFLLVIFSSLILKINIYEDDALVNEKVKCALENNGIKIFSNKFGIDKFYVKNLIMLEVQELSWVELEFKGNVLNVYTEKRDVSPDVIDETENCNVIAKKSGIISKVTTYRGNSVVKEGDLVEEGDLLVSGKIESERIEPYYVHADGEVLAKVWYQENVDMKYNQDKEIYTGNAKNIYGIGILNKKIFFAKLSTNYKEYDTMLNEKGIRLFNIYIPINLYEYSIKEKIHKVEIYSAEQLRVKAIEQLENIIKEKMDINAEIVDVRKYFNEYDDGIKVEVVYECIENIGTKEAIF